MDQINWRTEGPPEPSGSNAFVVHGRSPAFGRPFGWNQNYYSQRERSRNLDSLRYPRSFNCVETLVELRKKTSSEIIMELIAKRESFSELLESNMEPDWIVLIIAILSKAFSSAFTENKIFIMNIAAKTSFIKTLEKFIANLRYEVTNFCGLNRYLWNNADQFFVNLAYVCETWIELIPTRACEILPKLLRDINVRLPTLRELKSITVSETTNSKILSLIDKLDMCMEGLVLKKNGLLLPKNFRTMSVFPTSEEILSPDPAFVRTNIIEERYNNVEHYLDVQFRLLKEDFVAPLRQGISEFFNQSYESQPYMKFSNIKIVQEVVFHSSIFKMAKAGFLLYFSHEMAQDKIFKEHSKSFTYGSLVCFTNNNFDSILCGKVTGKDNQDKHLIISFEKEFDNVELNIPYLMVECKLYYKPYFLVLRALQCMFEADFPMKNKLIDADSSVAPPGYFDKGCYGFKVQNRKVDLFGNNWPTADECELNLPQYSAFKAALTQKFVMIQGPPGTGKTRLGLQILKTLLHIDNLKNWYNDSPILIIAFTNHALDQILKELLPITHEIVRVGRQSKCPELNDFILKNGWSKCNINLNAMYFWKSKLENCLDEIRDFSRKSKQLQKYDRVIHFKNFEVIDRNITNSWFTSASNKELLHWLLAERRDGDIKIQSNPIELSETIMQNIDEELEKLPEVDDDKSFASWCRLTILTSKHKMCTEIASTRAELREMERHAEQERDVIRKWGLETYLAKLWETYQYFKMSMRDGELSPPPVKPRDVNYHSPYRMHPNDRWNLYFYWLNTYQHYVETQLVELKNTYEEVFKKYNEIRNLIDAEVIKKKLVVGMTTSCAARLQTVLQTIKCKIVVVEEAAEVLESHVTVSLTKHCEHLILIGDHQELCPNAADYRREKKLSLGISMFERMLRNNIQCNTLNVQHRMRPEIANLIVPHIYPELENHDSVYNYPPILGMQSNLFFIHHEHQEFDDFNTRSNLHEAKFLGKLAYYLRQNGYQSEDITILAAYLGQFHVLTDELKTYGEFLSGVRISVLDNFQGDESKIILLSLVRNNDKGEIGFLKIENRVCVALSRAREGLYIMGNMNLLCDNSTIWPKIKEVLVKQNSLGHYLPLRCENHRDQIRKIRKPEDFDNMVAEGGCNRICGSLLKCGHNCSKTCHIVDSEHKTYVCNAICSKVICENGHVCRKLCYRKCGYCTVKVTKLLDCGHKRNLPCYIDPKTYLCKILVTAKLACGHEVLNKPCFVDVNIINCTLKCDARIETCGHLCTFGCHIDSDPEHSKERRCCKPCKKIALGCTTNKHKCQLLCGDKCLPCKVKVKRRLPNCKHTQAADCSADMSYVRCLKQCKKPLPCGHKCPKKCYEACGGCLEVVFKRSDCGHLVKTKCSETPHRRDCHSACPKRLQCGHLCKNRCNEACTSWCLELVDHDNNAVCGHNFKVPCHMVTQKLPGDDMELLKFCREPCLKILDCWHRCSGNCGQCFQGRLHLVCSEKCNETLMCGHKCMSLCGDLCKPCELKCSSNCGHTKCKKTCWEPCTQCRAPCARKCKHTQCKANCSGECSVNPCEKPCDELLNCGHPCIGFCGEPCPPFCRFCDYEILSDIYFGGEEDARFVLLDECKHVIESKDLQRYFQREDTENGVLVGYKRCPICKTPLASTRRYTGYIQETKMDIINIQRKVEGNFYERKEKYQKVIKRIDHLWANIGISSFSSLWLLDPLNKCTAMLIKYKPTFNLNIYKIVDTKVSILESIHKMNWSKLLSSDANKLGKYLHFLLQFLGMEDAKFNSQVIFDIEREMSRLQRIKQVVEHSVGPSDAAYLRQMMEFILQPILYTNDFDCQVKIKLEKLYTQLGLEIPSLKCYAILKDWNFTKRRWFCCRRGHYYMESNDPTQIASCDHDQCWK